MFPSLLSALLLGLFDHIHFKTVFTTIHNALGYSLVLLYLLLINFQTVMLLYELTGSSKLLVSDS